MNMKDMIQRMTDLENSAKQELNESRRINECPPMEGGAMPPAPMSQGTPVSMNVSLNASGADHVADLINMMKNAGLGDAKPAADAMLPMRQDMERLRAMVDEPEMEADAAYADSIEEGFDGEITDEVWQHIAARRAELVDDEGMEPEEALEQAAEEIGVDPEELEDWLQTKFGEGYDNEPNPEYQDHKYMTKDLSGGLNREKKAYAAAQDGDNAMAVEAIKAKLMAALAEKQKGGDKDNDGDEDFADVQVARMVASGMDKEKAIAKVNNKDYNK